MSLFRLVRKVGLMGHYCTEIEIIERKFETNSCTVLKDFMFG